MVGTSEFREQGPTGPLLGLEVSSLITSKAVEYHGGGSGTL